MAFYYSNPLRPFEFPVYRASDAWVAEQRGYFQVGFTAQELAKIYWRANRVRLNVTGSTSVSDDNGGASISVSSPEVVRLMGDGVTEKDEEALALPPYGQTWRKANSSSSETNPGVGPGQAGENYWHDSGYVVTLSFGGTVYYNVSSGLFFPSIEFACNISSGLGYESWVDFGGDIGIQPDWMWADYGGSRAIMIPSAKLSDWGTLYEGYDTISINIFGKDIYALRVESDDLDTRFTSSGMGSFSATVESWYGWNPGDDDAYPGKDGSGAVYDTATGERLRDPKTIQKMPDGTFKNPYYVP